MDKLREELEKELPALVFRDDPLIRKYTGLSRRTMANIDVIGKGVKKRYIIGGKVTYMRNDLIEFIMARIKESESKIIPKPKKINKKEEEYYEA